MPIFSTLFTIRTDMRHRYCVMDWACGRWCRIHKGYANLHETLIELLLHPDPSPLIDRWDPAGIRLDCRVDCYRPGLLTSYRRNKRSGPYLYCSPALASGHRP